MQALDNYTWVTGVIITLILFMVIVKTSQNNAQWKSMRSASGFTKVQPDNLPRPNLGKQNVSPRPRDNTMHQPTTRPNLRGRCVSPVKEKVVQPITGIATSSQQPTARPPISPKTNMGRKTTSISNLSKYNDHGDHYNLSQSLPQISVSAPTISYTCQRCHNNVDMRYTKCSMHKNDKLVCSKCFIAEWI